MGLWGPNTALYGFDMSITQLASEGDSFNSTAHAPVIDHDNGLKPSPKKGGHKNGIQIFRGPKAEGYGQSFL